MSRDDATDGESAPPSVPVLKRAVLCGASFALVEGVLVYSLGSAPPADALMIVATSLVAFAGLGFVLRVATATNGPSPTADAVLLATPVAILSLRGWAAAWPEAEYLLALSRWAPLAVLAVALVTMRRGGKVSALPIRRFAGLALVSQALAGVCAASRVVDFGEFRNLALQDPAARWLGPAVVIVVLLSLELCARRRHSGAWLAAIPVAAVAAFALVQGSRLGGPFSALGAANAAAANAAPSVLMVVLDTARADHFSLYGYPRATTPNLERFARRATVFERAYAASPYTLAAHASLFTGLLPSEHGAHPIPFTVQRSRRSTGHWPLKARGNATLAEKLRERGYATAAIAANYALLAEWTGLARGFQVYQCRAQRFYGYVPSAASLLAALGVPQPLALRSTWGADAVGAAAREWFARNSDPTFLFLNLMDAHDPFQPPPPFDRRFLEPGADAQATLMAGYDGELAFLDAQLGVLFDWLEGRGLLDPMLVIVTSDHGELLGEGGRWGHGQLLSEITLRVPLLIKLPFQAIGRRLPAPVSHLELASFVERVLERGGDLAALETLQRSEHDVRVMAEHWIAEEHRSKALPGEAASRAIYAGSWKLIQRLGAADELYDLASDPREENDLLSAQASAQGAPALLARATRVRLLRDVPGLRESLGGTRPVPSVDGLQLEKLRSLGYLGADSTPE